MSKSFNPSGRYGSHEHGFIRDDNESCPRFVALVGDSYVESDDNLEELIRTVVQDGKDKSEDVCLWDRWRTIAAVIRSTGEVVRFPEPQPKPVKDDTSARLQALLLKRKPKS